jgi:pimeloyl-ACP methyl ester carboxylesterase
LLRIFSKKQSRWSKSRNWWSIGLLFWPERHNNMMVIAGWLFAALLLVGLVSLVVLFQEQFIYFPQRYSKAQLEQARTLGVQEIRFQTTRGNQAAFFYRNENSEKAPQKVWLLFGGNGDVALGWLSLVRAIPGPRTGFLLIDYPGYGFCEGRPNPQTILENSECALQALLEQKCWKLGADALCVLGHSLGGAAALQFAAKHAVRKILVLSTFTTMDDMVRAQIHVPLGRLLRHRFDNVASLKAILSQNNVPEIDILHGQVDEVIPLKMGRALAQLDAGRIKFAEIPGAGHNDIVHMALALCLQSALVQQPE